MTQTHIWSPALLISCLLALGPATASAQQHHTVRPGETLSEIADRHDVSAAQLRRWNDLDGDIIQIDQRLIVGLDQPPDQLRTYVVAASDTLGCVAARFGVTVDELEQWNDGVHRHRILPGQQLSVPADLDDSLGDPAGRRLVLAGETLSSIAADLGVTLGELTIWNPGLDPDRLAEGQELIVRASRRLDHVVAEDETVSSIAERYEVELGDIVRWNPGLDPDTIRVGQLLRIHTRRPLTESVGSCSCGRLVNGRQLPAHPGYVLRDSERAWATDETIHQILDAFDEVRRRHPEVARARVHDLSLERGGPIDDHRSHQSGRDVDITYFQRSCSEEEGCPLEPVLPRRLDLASQWTLLEYWLHRGVAHRIFIGYGLQEVLYNYARRHGASRRELERWFQYPRGPRAPLGVIRHVPNHFDHIHVRFACPRGDERCHP